MQESQARMQENARFIFAVLSHSIRQLGYTGCHSRKPGAITNTLNNADSFLYRFERPLEGYEALASRWNPPLDAVISSPTAGNDIIVIRGSPKDSVRIIKPFMTSNAGALQVTANNDLDTDDIVMVSDCSTATVLQITNDSPNRSGAIMHTAGNGTPGNATTNLGKIYRDNAEMMQVITRVFYIGTGTSGLPALFQRSGPNPAEELVEGVEGMQILYGEDTDADSNANRYLPANQVDMEKVVSVKISLLLQSITDGLTSQTQAYLFNSISKMPTDHRIRRNFTTTIALRNRIP